MDATEELVKLRVSLARIAQAAGADNELKVAGKSYEELVTLARYEERGWHGLARAITAIVLCQRRID